MPINRTYRIIIILFLFGLFGACVFFYAVPRSGEIAKDNFACFNESRIEGEIGYCTAKNSGTEFSLQNEKTIYKFVPRVIEKESETFFFSRLAKRGDRVYKEAYADTIYLSSGGRNWAFRFVKFEKESP